MQTACEVELARMGPREYGLPQRMDRADGTKFTIEPLTGEHVCMMRDRGRFHALGGGYLMEDRWTLSPFSIDSSGRRAVTDAARWRARLKRALALRRQLFDEAVWPTDRSHRTVYSWLTCGLPRFYLLQMHGIRLPVLVPQNLFAMARIRQSLALFDALDLNVVAHNVTASIDRTWTIDPVSPPRDYNRLYNAGLLQDTAGYIRERIGKGPGQGPDRIYVSRQKSRRRILNAGEIEPEIEQAGFTTVFLEDLDFFDQVRLFANASAVVSVHGAGLANMIFCRPGTRIIELTQPAVRRHFFDLATVLGHDYVYLNGKGRQESNGRIHSNGDIAFRREEVAAVLRG